MADLSEALYANCTKHCSAREDLVIQDSSEVNLNHLQRSKSRLSEAEIVSLISDREFDVYEYLARIPDELTYLLVRMTQNRLLRNNSVRVVGEY